MLETMHFQSNDDLAFLMTGNSDSVAFLKFDNNLYYAANSINLLSINGVSYRNLSAYQIAQPFFNIASVEGNPSWASTDSLTSLGVLMNDAGDNTANVLVDINKDPRPITGALFVDIGAVEYDPPPCPAPSGLSVDVIDSDSANFLLDF